MTESVKLPPALKKKLLQLQLRSTSHSVIGKTAETFAQTFIQNKGYKLVGTNVRWRQFEADLVYRWPNQHTVIIGEVKFRRTTSWQSARSTISNHKLSKLYTMGNYLVSRFGWAENFQIDGLFIDTEQLRYFPNIGFEE